MPQSSTSKPRAVKEPDRKRVRKTEYPTGITSKMMMGMKYPEAQTVLGVEAYNRILAVLGETKGRKEARIQAMCMKLNIRDDRKQ